MYIPVYEVNHVSYEVNFDVQCFGHNKHVTWPGNSQFKHIRKLSCDYSMTALLKYIFYMLCVYFYVSIM